VTAAACDAAGGGGGGEGGGKGVSLRLRTAAHIFTETEMTAFYELMERCAYRPPDEAVEALAAELGLTVAVARTFVRKELAELAKMAQTRSAHAAMDRGRAAGARAQRRRALRLHALGHVQAQVQALAARVIVADAAATVPPPMTMAWREARATSVRSPALPCRG